MRGEGGIGCLQDEQGVMGLVGSAGCGTGMKL